MASRVGPATVLLVEDNRDDVAMIEIALLRVGIECHLDVVSDGSDALDYMFGVGDYEHRDVACPPDLVLLDLDLPRVNGHEFLRRIREVDETRLVPVAVLTVSAEEYDTVTAYDLGANGYVVKPLDGGNFVETVAAAIEYWLAVNEGPAAADC
ncbi:MAG: two-component system response regulator [Acidobacteria bacterium]|nr:MAG: two-component system response regulator [Acidobacteriota bacterium]